MKVAIVILDDDLNEIDSREWVLHASERCLERMDEWCTTTHTESGLVAEVRKSDLFRHDVAEEIADWFCEHGVDEEKPPLLGNSVHFDREFFRNYLSDAGAYEMLSHRNIDVSSFKECLRRWNPDAVPEKVEVEHRAMSDIRHSIEMMMEFRGLLEE